uniref:2-oxoacid dehydrogenase acyltransferase catalytic domain-containing protein n=1 Tax=Glossina palpalis gambiensis TaxID=67801 RepID=A0A1B0C5Z7_9MUSC
MLFNRISISPSQVHNNSGFNSKQSGHRQNTDLNRWHVKFDGLKGQHHSSFEDQFDEFRCLLTGKRNKWHWKVLEDHGGDATFESFTLKRKPKSNLSLTSNAPSITFIKSLNQAIMEYQRSAMKRSMERLFKEKLRQHQRTFKHLRMSILPTTFTQDALTCDHRLIDGREAVMFLRKIKAAVEDSKIMLASL